MTDTLPPAVDERIDEFCRQLALALRRILHQNTEANIAILPKPMDNDLDEKQQTTWTQYTQLTISQQSKRIDRIYR